MDWDDVRYFLAVKREGNLSAAAKVLKTQHTTVARRISALEESLGVRLFDRLPRGWVPTAEGQALEESATSMEREADALRRRALGHAPLGGQVRIAAPPALVTHFLVPQLLPFAERYPEIQLQLLSGTDVTNPSRGEADIVLRVGTLQPSGSLLTRRLGVIGYGLYGSSAHVARLEAERVYLGFDESMAGSAQSNWLMQHADLARVALLSNDLLALRAAAEHGYGIALLPHFLAAKGLGLVQLAPLIAPLERPLQLITHPDVRRSARVARLCEYIAEVVDAQREQLQGCS